MPLNDDPDNAEAPLGTPATLDGETPLGTPATLDGEDQGEEGGESDADRPCKRKKATRGKKGQAKTRTLCIQQRSNEAAQPITPPAEEGIHDVVL